MSSPSVETTPDDEPTWQQLALSFKALADPTRLHLLKLIATSPGSEACICHLIDPVGLSQPTVSHHMKLLTEAGLVTRKQRGKWAFYAIVPAAFDNLASSIFKINAPATYLKH